MTGYKRGAIVLLPFPFSNQSSAKIRPAVVVSPDYPSDDLLVMAVTSVTDFHLASDSLRVLQMKGILLAGGADDCGRLRVDRVPQGINLAA